MQYAILGPLAVRAEGRELAPGGRKQRAVLALLLVHANELVPTARIVEELWPAERPPATAVKTVQVYVSHLRKLLGETAIETRGPGYVLPVGPDDLDAARFERLVGESRRLLEADPAAAAEAAEQALGLWRGPALADVADLPFARGEIDRLEELRTVAREQRLEAELALGRHAQAVPELERLVEQQPLRERPRALLMLALYRSGRHAEALAAYQDVRRALVDELGLEPGQALQRLEKAILVQDAGLELPSPEPAPAPRHRPPAAPPARDALRCSDCGRPNAGGDRFCAACGAELGSEQPIELRKLVSVLFCDVVASTELGERLDPESLRRLMTRFFDEAAAVLQRHGGTVEKFVGDEVMAVFGVPLVRQDDALRAVRAASELRERIPQLRVPEWDGRLEVRIGVNSGDVVAGDPSAGHGFVTGDAVNVGKRLEQAAQPGEVVIGAGTHALVAHAVDAEPLGRVAAKGKTGGVEAYRLLGVDRDAQAFPVRPDVPLVGREEELRRLLDRYELAAAGRGTQLVTIVGQPGIGKSRLARELVDRVRREATTAVGRCRAYGEGITFWPLRELLGAAGADDRVLEGEGRDVFAAVRRTLADLAAERPLVAVIEDVHWAEPTLLDLLEYLAGRLAAARVLFVCLSRPELEERRPGWLRDAIVLEPLPLQAAEELLAAHDFDPAVRSRIAETAEGNPLFAEQLAAVADERGSGALPASIRGVIAERLDRLDREERAVLERAAVAGREFSLDTVVQLSPPRLREQALRRLLELVRKELVVPESGTGDAFRFTHALIRDAAYEEMPKVLRADLHEQLTARLAAAGDDPALLGYHLEQAHRHRSQLGRSDEETVALGARAAEQLRLAAAAALARTDVPAAVSLLERARVLLPASHPQHPHVLTELGYAYNRAGDFGLARDVLADAEREARTAGARAIELRALIERQFASSFSEPRAAAERNVRLARSLMPELEQLGDDLGLAKAWWLKSEGDVLACRWRERADALERALVHARRGAGPDVVSAISGLLSQALLWGPMPAPEASARCGELLDNARSDALRADVSTSLAGLLAMRGAFDDARAAYGRALAVYDEFGLQGRRAICSLIGSQIELLAGRPLQAERELRAAHAVAAGLGAPGVAATLAAVLADVVLLLDRLDEAEALTAEVEATAPDDDFFPQVLRRTVSGRLHARRGRLDEARRPIAEAVAMTDDVDFPELRASALLAAGEVAAAEGRDEAARSMIARARAVMSAKGNVAFVAQLDAGLAAPTLGARTSAK